MKCHDYAKLSFAERVHKDTVVNPETGCHEFHGRKDGKGYGQLKDHSRAILVHRWIWQRDHGPISSKQHVLHRCDNPSCINPEHLWLGDHKKNMEDKAIKGRSKNVPTGFAHKRPMAKLSDDQVIEIKRLLQRGYRACDIASDFGVSRCAISDINVGKTWTHIKC